MGKKLITVYVLSNDFFMQDFITTDLQDCLNWIASEDEGYEDGVEWTITKKKMSEEKFHSLPEWGS